MKLLLDECLPKKLKFEIKGHHASTVPDEGWAGKKNGELLRLMEKSGWEVFITADAGVKYQQNLKSTSLVIVVLSAKTN